MPVYEFRCDDCGRKVTLRYKTYADYDEATHTCTHCGGTNLTRLISRVAIKRSSVISRLMSDDMDNDTAMESALSELDDDPRTLGRMLREMGSEVGEDIGPEFDEVVTRLERGDDPEEIEASMPDLPDDSFGGGGLDDEL